MTKLPRNAYLKNVVLKIKHPTRSQELEKNVKGVISKVAYFSDLITSFRSGALKLFVLAYP